MIKCFHLTIRAPHGGAPIFEDLSFEIESESWAEIVGPSSSGKTLLFKLLSLQAVARKGQLLLGGRNLDRIKGDGYADLRRVIGSCGQRPELLVDRTALENIILPLVVRKDTRDAAHRALKLLEAVGAEHLRDLPVSAASHEDRLLVGVLRAIIGRPKIVVLDGCLEAFDDERRDALIELLADNRKKGATVVIFGRRPTPGRPDDARVWTLREGQLEETRPVRAPTTQTDDDVEEVAS
jgi:cell division transport system ATP-binding protein